MTDNHYHATHPSTQQAELLKDFGNNIGLALAFDDAGQCLLMVDEALISIRVRDERFVFHGLLGEFPQALPAGFWKHVLSMNSGLVEQKLGAMTIDLETDTLSLLHGVDVSTMAPGQLSGELREFVDQVNRLMTWLDRETAGLDARSIGSGGTGDPAPRGANDLFNRMA